MRHASFLHALATAGLFTGLFLGSSLISDAPAATAGHALAVSVDDFNYIDTSNEPTDQTAVHEKRLRAFMTALRDDVTADRRFELVPSSCGPNCPTDGPALRDACAWSRESGFGTFETCRRTQKMSAYRVQSGKHMLAVSSSQLDPLRNCPLDAMDMSTLGRTFLCCQD